MTEVWKEIQGTNGKYYISNKGNVKSTQGLLKPFVKNLYLAVNIRYGEAGKRYARSVHIHRLVANAFIPNSQNKPQVNHIDGDKMNNNVGNLEWVTVQENQTHKAKVLGKDSAGKNNPMYGKCGINGTRFKDFILQVDKNNLVLNKFESALEAARFINGVTKHNIGASKIAECCRNARKSYHGYRWIFEKEYKS